LWKSVTNELGTTGTKETAISGRFADAGAYMIMLESEGITESVKSWRTDVPTRFVNSLGLEKVMFEGGGARGISMIH
jgi:phosphosulfolactate synthase (CoM biosynthesis protein A)